MFANKMQKVAKGLIDKYGSMIDLVEEVRGAYNVDTGEYDVMKTTHKTKGHIQSFDDSLILSGVVNMDDLLIVCYNFNGQLPNKDWKVIAQGRELTIMGIHNVVTAQDQFITYDLHCRV